MSKIIKVNAVNIYGFPITNLKDNILLDLESMFNTITLSCNKEENNGVYIFCIPDDVDRFSKVFVRLKSQVYINTQISPQRYEYVFLCDKPHFLVAECHQINILEVMCNNDKAIPFTFNIKIESSNIGLIKAYKKNKDDKFINDITGLSNTNNEIYTIDLEQEIQLQAFIYKQQKIYANKVYDHSIQIESDKIQNGNISKIIDKEQMLRSNDNIRWAFKVVGGSYLIKNKVYLRNNPFPLLKNKKLFTNKSKISSIPSDEDYFILENIKGLTINIKLRDLFDDKILQDLVDKNIIFFAYNKLDEINTSKDPNINAYHLYQSVGKGAKKQIQQDKITSIELKIIQTSFRLEFNGKNLMLLENERIINKWEARSGIPLDSIESNMETKRNKLKIKDFKTNKFYYYDLNIHTQDSTKPLKEGEYNISTTYNPQELNIQNIDLLNNKGDICSTFEINNIPQNISIPLRVKYQKRTLIVLQRFKETLESTEARMYVYMDNQRVNIEFQENILSKTINNKGKTNIVKEHIKTIKNINVVNEELNFDNLSNKAFAYILDRPGPDCIAGELNLRIPSGRYNISWHNGKIFQNVIKLGNDFVNSDRVVLIHDGISPKNSNGCMLISSKQAFFKDEIKAWMDTKTMKKLFAELLKKYLPLLINKNTQNVCIENYIEIMILNNFDIDNADTSQELILSGKE
ncbi:hypothetical protein DCO58_07525 [Helicobacter saguini]|uniref:DUF5675 domain-containing protein n=1 Tax=Helicobacter saguini TaxID=1548018 RepID=A0A347VNC7_9HELI|nr:DUF5675 family protein [Helicobacter saguini]MWV61818.1 hypothetical protein [Helicobacter saguini]MWV67507.1 hypothetical protein [Helicobacter saguini]MWV69858.1 hypothetical protein [Helicobacter saguini]MWV72924.1 hypothetical protein [Helicobacter saguini]TLD93276.1 hypothetical protein LS64_009185 [Helicobacter saguini]